MRANSQKIWKMDLEHLNGKMGIYIKGNLKMIYDMELEKWNGLMELYI